MRPHPKFSKYSIPTAHSLGEMTLRAITVNDLDRDFTAVMESAADIKAAHPNLTWPKGLTKEKNLIDLAWHQKEFEARRSFTWIIENSKGDYLGCLYVYPSIAGDDFADVVWWWRTGAEIPSQDFRELLVQWFKSSDWPDWNYKLQES